MMTLVAVGGNSAEVAPAPGTNLQQLIIIIKKSPPLLSHIFYAIHVKQCFYWACNLLRVSEDQDVGHGMAWWVQENDVSKMG